jgi:hypothetical protein
VTRAAKGDVTRAARADAEAVPVVDPKESAEMAPLFFRLTVLAAAVLSSAFLGGWKWDSLPH